jgi:uncharacterized membrane protein
MVIQGQIRNWLMRIIVVVVVEVVKVVEIEIGVVVLGQLVLVVGCMSTSRSSFRY